MERVLRLKGIIDEADKLPKGVFSPIINFYALKAKVKELARCPGFEDSITPRQGKQHPEGGDAHPLGILSPFLTVVQMRAPDRW